MPFTRAFQTNFWSPTASVDPYPDFKHGFTILHQKLSHSMTENESVMSYIQQRIDCERQYGQSLSKLLPSSSVEDLSTLSRCFQVVCAESQSSSQEHLTRAENVHSTSLDPLQRFVSRYQRLLTEAQRTVELQIHHFSEAVRQLELAQATYQTKCQQLLSFQPNYRPQLLRLGSRQFHERSQVEDWLRGMSKTTHDDIGAWLVDQGQSASVLHDLVGLNFLRKVDEDRYEKTVNTRRLSGFFKRGQQSHLKEMLQADTLYRDWVVKVDKMRTQTEEMLFIHYEEMESLELERIETLKQAFISLAASLSNTIPRYKETVDNMMLYQETLKPDKDVQMIVEQYRTGQFCPRPILYENYFYGTSRYQLFGVSLDEIVRTEGTLIPRFISHGMSAIESGLLKLKDEEKKHIWTTSVPLDRVHAAREEINQQYPLITKELFKRYDILLIASLIKLYLMELPECLFTFELYEPCKLLYSNQNQDQESRLFSTSKLLATLPTANYQVCKGFFSHFHRLIEDSTLSKSLAHSLSYILLRPQTESKVSTFERHSQKLIQDLINHQPLIFNSESEKTQIGRAHV